MRRVALSDLAERSAPLVAAIERYEETNGDPPKSLQDLVPEYLPAIPGTLIGACSEYEYHVSKPAQGGNTECWMLSVNVYTGLTSFSWFSYMPNRDLSEAPLAQFKAGNWYYFVE